MVIGKSAEPGRGTSRVGLKGFTVPQYEE